MTEYTCFVQEAHCLITVNDFKMKMFDRFSMLLVLTALAGTVLARPRHDDEVRPVSKESPKIELVPILISDVLSNPLSDMPSMVPSDVPSLAPSTNPSGGNLDTLVPVDSLSPADTPVPAGLDSLVPTMIETVAVDSSAPESTEAPTITPAAVRRRL